MPLPTRLRKRGGMTLVEVMVSMVVFAITILGTFALLMFGMRTMDTSRAFTQATQILTHEMEAMRLRSFDGPADTAGKGQLTIKYLGENIKSYAAFTPFADYNTNGAGGSGDAAIGTAQPQVSKDVLGDTKLQLRNATGFTCSRDVALNTDKDSAEITLTVTWTDSRNMTHTRSMSSTASKNGLNDSLFIARTSN